MKTKRKNITWRDMPGSDELDKKLNFCLWTRKLVTYERVNGRFVNTGALKKARKRAA
jgi:hypothetical protein